MEMMEEVRTGGPQDRSRYFGVEEKLLPLRTSKPRLSFSRYTEYGTLDHGSKHIRTKSKITHHLLV
jgi:hypothetical protein